MSDLLILKTLAVSNPIPWLAALAGLSLFAPTAKAIPARFTQQCLQRETLSSATQQTIDALLKTAQTD
ncbi:MAG: hypothetical protein AAFQ61_06795, partial [Cyanobacteria bacterium J06626_23]